MSDREWITDRLPTAADADEDGDVTVQNRPKAEPSPSPYFHWKLVVPGMTWCHTDIWEAENEPAPAPKPALAVGQRWRRRDGEVVTVDRYDNNHLHGATHPFWAGGSSYTVDGIYNALGRRGSGLDLVELIEPAAEPRRFVSISRTVWMNQGGSQCHTIDAIADDGTAWWMAPGETDWQQAPALPAREVQF